MPAAVLRLFPSLRGAVGSRVKLRCFLVLGEVGKLAQNVGRAHQTLFWRLPLLEEYHLHVRPDLRRLTMLTDEIDQAIRLRELVVAEGDDHTFRTGIDLLDIGAAAIAF